MKKLSIGLLVLASCSKTIDAPKKKLKPRVTPDKRVLIDSLQKLLS